MSFNYNTTRNMYYGGILLLIVYALPEVGIIKDNIYPLLQYKILFGMPLISIIALVIACAAFMAFKYRKIG
jgi:hypothetical protein